MVEKFLQRCPNWSIALDLDGVIRHNNKSLGTGDIPAVMREKDTLRRLHEGRLLPKGYYTTKPEDVVWVNDAVESIVRLTDAGRLCFVLTNQEAIGVGVMTERDWGRVKTYMHRHMLEKGGIIRDWFHCPHRPGEGCECRKPKPGMFLELAEKWQLDMGCFVYVGDNPSDMEAAHDAGVGLKIHVVLPTAEPEFRDSSCSNVTVGSLKEAVDLLL